MARTRRKPRTRRAAATAAARAGDDRGLGRLLKLVGALVGVVTSVTGLVFVFWPDLKPSGSAKEQSAQLSKLRIEPYTTFGHYLARIDQPTTSFTRTRLAERGVLVEFRVAITGFKGRDLRLKWELFEDATGAQLAESKAISIRPTNEKNEARWPFWIPVPHRAGPYYAVVELLEQKAHYSLQLDSIETPRFSGLSRSA